MFLQTAPIIYSGVQLEATTILAQGGTLNNLDTAIIDIILSEDGFTVGSLALSQFDTDINSTTFITFSGQATVSSHAPVPVPEPSTFVLLGFGLLGLVALRQKRKDLTG